MTPHLNNGDQPLVTRLRMTILRTSRRLRLESAGSLSEGQLSVLATLFTHGAMTPGELAQREHVRPPSLTRTLQFLEQHNYIQRRPDPSDRRCVVVDLAPTGREYINETRRRRDQWLEQRLASLTPEQRRILEKAEEILNAVVTQ